MNMKDMNYEGEKLITAVIMQAVEDAGYDGINKKFLKVKQDAIDWIVGNDPQLLKNKKQIVLFGFYEEEVAAIREHSSLPVSTEQVHSDEYSDSILIYKDNLEVFKRDYTHDKSLNNKVLTELILMKKFK